MKKESLIGEFLDEFMPQNAELMCVLVSECDDSEYCDVVDPRDVMDDVIDLRAMDTFLQAASWTQTP